MSKGKKQTGNTKRKPNKLAINHYMVGILPLLVFGIVILVLGSYLINRALTYEVERQLESMGATVEVGLNQLFPGEYKLKGDEALYLYKGEHDITTQYDFIDAIHKNTGLEISLFYQDTRIQTTLEDSKGVRMIGTGAANQIIQKVIKNDQPAFFHNTTIGRESYFSYYRPLHDPNGNVIGMIAIAKPTLEVLQASRRILLPLFLVDILLMICITIGVSHYTKGITSVWKEIHRFLSEAAAGNASVTLNEKVLARDDELSSIGSSIVTMHRSMRDMMERDPLTKLFNRRSADRRFGILTAKALQSGKPLTVAIGDIDFFKRVNDTYGHDAGDAVLVAVASLLQEHMKAFGFAARWGGEEFLLVYERADCPRVKNLLEELRTQIHALAIPAEGTFIRVTMSFGVSSWDNQEKMDAVIKRADDNLYYSKTHGRDQITADPPKETAEPVEIDDPLAVDIADMPDLPEKNHK